MPGSCEQNIKTFLRHCDIEYQRCMSLLTYAYPRFCTISVTTRWRTSQNNGNRHVSLYIVAPQIHHSSAMLHPRRITGGASSPRPGAHTRRSSSILRCTRAIPSRCSSRSLRNPFSQLCCCPTRTQVRLRTSIALSNCQSLS